MSALNLDSLINKALSTLSEAYQQREDMFGEAKPGRTYEDLKWVAAPTTNPVDRRTGQPTGQPWTESEVWAAIRPMIVKRANDLSGGAFSKSGERDQGVFDDLVQTAAIGVIQALRQGKDEGRLGNSFQSWVDNIIRSSMQQGSSAAAYYRPARGILGVIEAARDTATAGAALDNAIAKGDQAGPYKEQLVTLATNLKNAYDAGDQNALKKLKRDAMTMRNDLKEKEEGERSQGAFTGLHDTISVRGRKESHDKFRQEHGKMKGLETQNSEGETMESPMTPYEPSHVGGLANREAAYQFLDYARKGYKGPDGEHPPLSNRDFRILIRQFGLSNYPGAGTVSDPEFDKDRYGQTLDALEAGQSVPVQPQNMNELQRLAQLIHADDVTYQQMLEAFREYNDAKDSGQNPGEPISVNVRTEDPDAQDEIAMMNAFSPWSRSGRPQLGIKAMKQDLGFDFSDQRMLHLINAITKGIKDRPSKKGKPGWASELAKKVGPRLVGHAPEAMDDSMEESAVRDTVAKALLEFDALITAVESKLLLEHAETRSYSAFRKDLRRHIMRLLGEELHQDDQGRVYERPSAEEVGEAFDDVVEQKPDCSNCYDHGCWMCR